MRFEQTESTSWTSWEWRAIARESKSSIVVWPKSLFLSEAAVSASGKIADTLLNDSQQRCFSVALWVEFTKDWYRLSFQGLSPGKLLFLLLLTLSQGTSLYIFCAALYFPKCWCDRSPMEEGCWLASFSGSKLVWATLTFTEFGMCHTHMK